MNVQMLEQVRVMSPDGVHLQLVPVDDVHLFEYVVDVPHLDCSVKRARDHLTSPNS